MAPTDSLFIKNISKSTHLVLFIIEKCFKSHNVGSHHVTGCVFGGIKGSSLGEDNPSAMLVSVRENEYVAFVNKIGKSRVLER